MFATKNPMKERRGYLYIFNIIIYLNQRNQRDIPVDLKIRKKHNERTRNERTKGIGKNALKLIYCPWGGQGFYGNHFSGLNTKHKNVLTAPDDVEVARMIQRQAC